MRKVESSTRSPLLPTEAYRFALAERLRAAEKKSLIVSAYLTIGGLEWISRLLPAHVQVSILTRWQARDLVGGSSDLASFWFAQSHGWEFRIMDEVHAKCCLIDDDTIFLGSANFTNNGLCLSPGGNRELGLFAKALPDDVQSLWSLYGCGVVVTTELARLIQSWIEKRTIPSEPVLDVHWPADIKAFLTKKSSGIWVADLPWASVQSVLTYLSGMPLSDQELEDVRHDLSVFGASSPEQLGFGFRQSSCIRWLVSFLSRDPAESSVFFGRLADALHNSLLDDPRPYRKDVKTLLSHLISYTIMFADDIIQHDRPNYSERLTLRK